RGEVYWVTFSPAVGSEQAGRRPAVIVQNDIGNYYAPTTVVVPVTTMIPKRQYPTVVIVAAGEGGLPQASAFLANQIRTVDKRRLGERLGALSPRQMAKLEQAIKVNLDLP
ncbi:MAG: type II toxin-antitoxin system PemK/MazF family toxin, partial [Deinococcus sp.]|nr:type II toxin-antitoxin system PemK/MazF family toxin [Deinococcus sp.]